MPRQEPTSPSPLVKALYLLSPEWNETLFLGRGTLEEAWVSIWTGILRIMCQAHKQDWPLAVTLREASPLAA